MCRPTFTTQCECRQIDRVLVCDDAVVVSLGKCIQIYELAALAAALSDVRYLVELLGNYDVIVRQ